jgi:hypothetical protein
LRFCTKLTANKQRFSAMILADLTLGTDSQMNSYQIFRITKAVTSRLMLLKRHRYLLNSLTFCLMHANLSVCRWHLLQLRLIYSKMIWRKYRRTLNLSENRINKLKRWFSNTKMFQRIYLSKIGNKATSGSILATILCLKSHSSQFTRVSSSQTAFQIKFR